MRRTVLLRLALLAVAASMLVSASQTLMQVKIYDVPPANPGDQYTAAVPGTGYAGVRTQVVGGVGIPGAPSGTFTGFSSTVDYFNSGAYCVDPDQLWTTNIKNAYVTSLDDAAALADVETKLGRGTVRNYTSNGATGALTVQDRYQMAAYLTRSLDASSSTVRGAIWGAIWTLTDIHFGALDIPVVTPINNIDSVIAGATTGKDYWIAQARDARNAGYANSGIQWQSYVLISEFTNSAPYFQEFITQVPEPGAYFLMGTAFFGVIMVVRRRRRMSGQAHV